MLVHMNSVQRVAVCCCEGARAGHTAGHEEGDCAEPGCGRLRLSPLGPKHTLAGPASRVCPLACGDEGSPSHRPYYRPQQKSAGFHIGMWREEGPKSACFPQARAGLHSRRRRSPRSAAAPRGDCIPRLGVWDGSVPSFAARLALCGLLEPWGAVPPPRHSPDVALMNRRSWTTHCSRTACRTA